MKKPDRIKRIEELQDYKRTIEEKEYLKVWKAMYWYRSALDHVISSHVNSSHKIARKALEYENDK